MNKDKRREQRNNYILIWEDRQALAFSLRRPSRLRRSGRAYVEYVADMKVADTLWTSTDSLLTSTDSQRTSTDSLLTSTDSLPTSTDSLLKLVTVFVLWQSSLCADITEIICDKYAYALLKHV